MEALLLSISKYYKIQRSALYVSLSFLFTWWTLNCYRIVYNSLLVSAVSRVYVCVVVMGLESLVE